LRYLEFQAEFFSLSTFPWIAICIMFFQCWTRSLHRHFCRYLLPLPPKARPCEGRSIFRELEMHYPCMDFSSFTSFPELEHGLLTPFPFPPDDFCDSYLFSPTRSILSGHLPASLYVTFCCGLSPHGGLCSFHSARTAINSHRRVLSSFTFFPHRFFPPGLRIMILRNLTPF